MPLPFNKKIPLLFLDNNSLAFKRTTQAVEKLKITDPDYLQRATKKMEQNFISYPPKFRRVPNVERHGQRSFSIKANWIPLMMVYSKGKARIVFDAAAKKDG